MEELQTTSSITDQGISYSYRAPAFNEHLKVVALKTAFDIATSGRIDSSKINANPGDNRILILAQQVYEWLIKPDVVI